MDVIVLTIIRPGGRTYVLYAASFSCLFCVLTFRLINLRLFWPCL